MPRMTVIEYADYRGVSDSSVYRAITEGRITLQSDGRNRYLDSEVADKEWFENTDPTYTRGESAKRALEEVGDEILASDLEPDQTTASSKENENDSETDQEEAASQKRFAKEKNEIRTNINAAKAKRESYQAELARLKYEEQAGVLVNADAVRNEAFKIGRTVRDAMLAVPDRVSAEFSAETNQFKIHQRLTEEIRKALVALKIEEENGPA